LCRSHRTSITPLYTLSLHDALPIYTLRFPRVTRELFGVSPWPLFPQDKECFFEINRTQKKRFSFSRSLRVLLSLVLCFVNPLQLDRKSTRLNSSHVSISYAVFCLRK